MDIIAHINQSDAEVSAAHCTLNFIFCFMTVMDFTTKDSPTTEKGIVWSGGCDRWGMGDIQGVSAARPTDTQNVALMLVQHCSTVVDGGPMLTQH